MVVVGGIVVVVVVAGGGGAAACFAGGVGPAPAKTHEAEDGEEDDREAARDCDLDPAAALCGAARRRGD